MGTMNQVKCFLSGDSSSAADTMNPDKRPICEENSSAADSKKTKQATKLCDHNYLPTDGTKLPKIVPVEGDLFLTIQEKNIPDDDGDAEMDTYVVIAKLE